MEGQKQTRTLKHTYAQTSHTVYFPTLIACHECVQPSVVNHEGLDVWLEMLQYYIGKKKNTTNKNNNK